MAYEISERLKRLSQQRSKVPQLIIDIEGFPYVIGAIPVTRYWVIGDAVNIGDAGLFVGGVIEEPNQKKWIDDKTSSVLSQQLLLDRGGAGSTTRLKVKVIDKNEEATNAFSPGQVVAEPIYKRVTVYQTFKGGAHPFDSIKLLSGLLTDINYNAGNLDLQISSPEDLKKREIYKKYTSKLTAGINNSDTTIPVVDTSKFITDQDTLTSYIIIDKEIIKVGAKTSTTFTGCTRGQLGTTAEAYSTDKNIRSMYRFVDDAIDLSLKMMISGSGIYASDVSVSSFVKTRPTVDITNAIYFLNESIKDKYGLVIGSFVTSTGAINSENNFTNGTITGFGSDESGTYFMVQKQDLTDLVVETSSTAKLSFKSQFDLYPEGCSMTPQQVDIQQHVDFQDLLSTTFPTLDFREGKTIKASDLINEQIYYPSGLYQIPRKGRASVNVTLPPLAIRGTKTFDETNVKNPNKLSIRRSLSKFFYNEITFKYNYDPVTNEFDSEVTDESEESKLRIPIGNRPLNIEARGLRDTHVQFIGQQSRRYLARYQFGADSFSIDVNYGDSFTSEIGDASIFGSESLKMSDTTIGSRKFKKRLVEIINAKNNPVKGKMTFDMLDTSSTLDGRFVTFGPSSNVSTGATTTEIPLKKSFSTGDLEEENLKWERYVGEKIRVHSTDYTFDEEVTLTKFKAGSQNTMVVTALSIAPSEDYIVNQPKYSGDEFEKETWKLLHGCACPEVQVVAGVSQTEIDVGADVSKFFIGSIIRVHKLDFTTDTDTSKIVVSEINANIITVTDLGFTPDNTYVINLIGFNSDEGKPYRYI